MAMKVNWWVHMGNIKHRLLGRSIKELYGSWLLGKDYSTTQLLTNATNAWNQLTQAGEYMKSNRSQSQQDFTNAMLAASTKMYSILESIVSHLA